MHTVTGLYVTAIAGPAQENLDFYAGILGMRLVKRASTRMIRNLPSLLRRRGRTSRDRLHFLSRGRTSLRHATATA